MKKIWMIVAVACVAFMVACGGDKKVDSVEAKAKELATALVNAHKAGDQAAYDKINEEGRVYYNSLSDADKEKFQNAVRPIGEAAGLL